MTEEKFLPFDDNELEAYKECFTGLPIVTPGVAGRCFATIDELRHELSKCRADLVEAKSEPHASGADLFTREQVRKAVFMAYLEGRGPQPPGTTNVINSDDIIDRVKAGGGQGNVFETLVRRHPMSIDLEWFDSMLEGITGGLVYSDEISRKCVDAINLEVAKAREEQREAIRLQIHKFSANSDDEGINFALDMVAVASPDSHPLADENAKLRETVNELRLELSLAQGRLCVLDDAPAEIERIGRVIQETAWVDE